MYQSNKQPLGVLLLTVTLLVACGGGEESGVPMDSPLLDPDGAAMNESSPELFQARFETTAGDFVIEVNKEWAPTGVDRFYNLVNNGFYDGVAFFRVIEGFMVQFGIHGDPLVSASWQTSQIPDDPPTQSNTRGTVSFAMTSQSNSRTTQIFINFGDNSNLDSYDFAPFGTVTEGMDVVDQLYSGYGEGAPQGRGPDQLRFTDEGNAYLQSEFPELDYVERVTIIGG
jgi:peptidyl-prolyl cis-trans isomerase A (cyclophilin A)